MNILVDSSVWMAHFRYAVADLLHLLDGELALMHPMVWGEIACGTPPQRTRTLTYLNQLPPVSVAGLREVMDFIERERLHGLGCGFVDMNLLASVLITPGARLWTLDKRLNQLAERFHVAYQPVRH